MHVKGHDSPWEWTSWEYESSYCPPGIHTNEKDMKLLIKWLASHPHLKRSGEFNLDFDKAKLLALTVGMLMRDIYKGTFSFDRDQPRPIDLPEHIWGSQLRVTLIHNSIVPFCVEVAAAITAVGEPPTIRSSKRDRRQTTKAKGPDHEDNDSTLPPPAKKSSSSKRTHEPAPKKPTKQKASGSQSAGGKGGGQTGKKKTSEEEDEEPPKKRKRKARSS